MKKSIIPFRLLSYLTCFTTGMVILVIELASFRFLAPSFGTSSYVTGIIINTVLLALAIGYYVGGYISDHIKNPHLPYLIILATTVYLAIIYLFYSPLVQSFSQLNAINGSFVVILIMFFLPMIALAFIPPFLIRILSSTDTVGTTAGRIYSLSTLGSIIGGLLTTFVFIPYLGSQITFLICLVLLSIITILGFLPNFIFSAISLILMLLVLFVPPFTEKAENVLLYKESQYNILKVTEKDKDRFLFLNEYMGFHSCNLDKNMLSNSFVDDYLMAPMLTEGKDILILGNGSGTSMIQMQHFFNANIDGVEIDPEITMVGEKFFNFDFSHEKMNIYHEDARVFLKKTNKKYDVIVVDLFHGSPYVPFHVTTVEFYQMIQQKLKPDGVLTINMPGYAQDSILEDYYHNTIKEVFPYLFGSNHILYAFFHPITEEIITNRVNQYLDDSQLSWVIITIMDDFHEIEKKDESFVFTDNFAPVERYSYKIFHERMMTLFEEYHN
ncbi:MAG: fused MFS/spermidine synthase [Spirochaetes bacterium]|nr:fused MFS/spermidine synthase [Spirochaetota bacterium]